MKVFSFPLTGVFRILPLLPLAVLLLPSLAPARDIESEESMESMELSDKIHKGAGVIDLLEDIKGNDLASYFNQTGGLLLLGADVNEDNSGNESRKSVGVAIKEAQLSIRTTEGDFSFKDFFTSTSAMLHETGGSGATEYATLFGQGGSSQINGSGDMDLSDFDDVMWFENVAFKGEILSALLKVSFLPTNEKDFGENEEFFDFSGGFEDFALLNVADAILLEEANIGIKRAPSGIVYQNNQSVTSAIKEALATNGGNTGGSVLTPPAAPSPPFFAVASIGLLMLWKKRKESKLENA